MEKLAFIHKISRGSRFNQIYIPKEMNEIFEVGDTVRVELVGKNAQVFYSKKTEINEFKEKLAREIFSFLSKFKGITQIFLVGSFITQKADYRDIDLLIVVKKDKNAETYIYDKLIEKFSLNFHVILVPEERIMRLAEICPLTRSMLCCYISNKKFILPERKVDINHIKFLLMMPEDLLKIKVNGRTFYDSIRRLITIENFLGSKEIDLKKIELELKQILGGLFEYLKNNEEIDGDIINKLRKIIKIKLRKINKIIR